MAEGVDSEVTKIIVLCCAEILFDEKTIESFSEAPVLQVSRSKLSSKQWRCKASKSFET